MFDYIKHKRFQKKNILDAKEYIKIPVFKSCDNSTVCFSNLSINTQDYLPQLHTLVISFVKYVQFIRISYRTDHQRSLHYLFMIETGVLAMSYCHPETEGLIVKCAGHRYH